jgi:predicted amidohydrolase
MIKIATCQYALEVLSDWDAYTNKIIALVTQAKQQGAQLLLLPEYAGTEMPCGQHANDEDLYAALQPFIPKYLEFYQHLACEHQIYFQPGTVMVENAPSQYVNRAYFFGPEGEYGYQDKLQLVEFEKTCKVLQGGDRQTLFETSLGTIGIAICYDSEFPELVRRLVNAGANLILVPSYTTTLAGYYRVAISCRARAIENQCYVMTSCMVGEVGGGVIEHTVGQAGIFCPADAGFPDDGIIAQGKMNAVEMIVGEISFEKLSSVRRHGQVHNFTDAKRCELLAQSQINTQRL